MHTYTVSKQIAYGALPAPGADGKYALPPAYEAKARTAVADQLTKAGVRLAALLNRALVP